MRVGVIATSVAAACQFTHGTNPEDGNPAGDKCKGSSDVCVGDMLRSCQMAGDTPADTPCGWGCIDVVPAHCAAIVPSGSGGVGSDGVMPSDVLPDDLSDVTLGDGITIDSDNGRIGTLAMPNLHHGAAAGVENGIDFVFRGPISVFRFKSLTING